MNKSVEEKKEILVRNVFAFLGGMLLVILFILLAPLYDIFEDFKITYINNTLSQIMTKYIFVVVIASFVVFLVGFYIVKKVMLMLQEKRAQKIVAEHKR